MHLFVIGMPVLPLGGAGIFYYAKQVEIGFGRNGKRNMSENPFARNDRRE